MHKLDGPDVETTGRLRRDKQAQFAAELAGENNLLLVTAGEATHVGADALGTDVELDNLLLGEFGEVPQLQGSGFHKRGLVGAVEHQVLGNGEFGDEAVFLAVFRHKTHTGVEHLAHVASTD